MANQPGNTPRVPAQNDLYTALLVLAAATLLVGLIFVLTQSIRLYEWPFGVGG